MAYKHLCPVCEKYEFKHPFEECPVCNWQNDEFQEEYPNEGDAGWCNTISLKEAKKAYKEGNEVY